VAVHADLEPAAVAGCDQRVVGAVVAGDGERGRGGESGYDRDRDRVVVRCEHAEPHRG
jgi:hypothetical protein